MTLARLVLRSIRHFAFANGLAAICLALSTSIICGSLVVGTSVRESLRDAALARLGSVTHAVVSSGLFPDDLANRLSSPVQRSAALIISRGAASTDSGAVVPRVSVIGVDPSFWALYPGIPVQVDGQDALINRALAGALGVRAGDDLIVTLARTQSAPLDTLFAQRTREGSVVTLRLHVAGVLPDGGAGSFALDAATVPPRLNLFIARDTLAAALGKPGVANALLVRAVGPVALSATPADCGLRIAPDNAHNCLYLTTDRLLLRDGEIDAARRAAGETGGASARVSVFLADSTRDLTSGKTISYAIVAAMDGAQPGAGGVRINPWAASDLAAHPGDKLELNCLTPRDDGAYATSALPLRVESIVAPVDRNLTPRFEGITDAARISDWNPPFPVDLSRVTARDEQYWSRYRAAPRMYVRMADARHYWSLGPSGAQTGWVTSLRISVPAGESLSGYKNRFEAALSRDLDPAAFGLSLQPVRALALRGARGSTDFGSLFLCLGMFVILAAAASASMLMRLAVERRSAQIGLLKAIGLSNSQVTRAIVAEGLIVAAIGALLGGPLGLLYGAAIVWALTGPWSGAATGLALSLHPSLADIATGILAGFLIGAIASIAGVRKVLGISALGLLTGMSAIPPRPSARRPDLHTEKNGPAATERSGPPAPHELGGGRARLNQVNRYKPAWLAVLLIAAVALSILGKASEDAFFALGFVLLMAGLVAADLAFSLSAGSLARSESPTVKRRLSLAHLAQRNMAMNRGHGLLILGLVAASSFLLVAVAANARRVTAASTGDIESGSGGFSLVATSSLPIPGDFSTSAGRARLGFSADDEAVMAGSKVYGLLVSPGEDTSCLNLAHATAPKMLGVSHELIERGGFSVRWRDLQADGNKTPAIADSDTAQWILNTDVGQTYHYRNGPVATDLTMAALIPGSIFAGELLVSDDRFRAFFPDERAPRMFLIQTALGREDAVAAVLRRNLGGLGLDVRKSADLLNAVAGVQNTYISAFAALGGLGLLLGTGVLAAMLLRSAVERRKELALLCAVGFRAGSITLLLLSETAGLLIAGVLWGALCALIAVAPHLHQSAASPNWPMVSVLLGSVLIVGTVVCFVAGSAVSRGSEIAALRSE